MTIEEYQEILFIMLSDLADMCDQNGLLYYLLGGTALGAVRHHGFIPWDDDIDLCLPRKDYDRLLDMVPAKMPAHYKLIYRKNAGIYHFVDTRTTIEFKDDNATQGNGTRYYPCIDIFPLDGAPGTRIGRLCRIGMTVVIRFFVKLGCIQYCYESIERRGWENKIIRIAKRLHTEKYIAPEYFTGLWDKVARKNDYQTSQWCMLAHGISKMKDTFPKDWVGSGCMLPFGTKRFRVFSNFDAYLTQLYGDYMTPIKQADRQHSTWG